MSTSHMQINPRLIAALTGGDLSAIDDKPTIDMIPGKYAKRIYQNIHRVELKFPSNPHWLYCNHCGKKGKYDLGLVLVDVEKIKNQSSLLGVPSSAEIMKFIQPTGYFRCKHCNRAGDWFSDSSYFQFAVFSQLIMEEVDDISGFAVGSYALYDGMKPHWATDAEEHYLDKIEQEQETDKAYIWNRLGNLYYSGGRPELAGAALEHSIKLDVTQMESHFTLGNLLYDIGELESASFHYRNMCLHAQHYKKLKPEDIRMMLAEGLSYAMDIHIASNKQIPFLPVVEDAEPFLGKENLEKEIEQWQEKHISFHLHPDDVESFFPLAELFMGDQKKAIPKRKRRIEKAMVHSSGKKRKAKQKKKKKMKK